MDNAVLTRDAIGAAPYASALAALGLDAVAMPVTRTVPPPDPDALRRALATPYDAILVASARAASALVTAGSPGLGTVWAVGPATARILVEAGIAARQPATGSDAAALARAVLASVATPAGLRVLVPRAEDGREDGVALLRAAGAVVDEVIAYRTVAVERDDPAIARGRDLLVGGHVAICAMFAPSQVTALVTLVGPLISLRTQFAAIGQTTAGALTAAGVAPVAIAASPTPGGMAEAIAAVYPRGR